MPPPWLIPAVLSGINLLTGSRRAGQANDLQEQAIDIALADRAERGPLREAFTAGALSPIASAPDLSGVFHDPTNPFSRSSGPLPHVGSQLDFGGIDLTPRTARPRQDPTQPSVNEVPFNELPPGTPRDAGGRDVPIGLRLDPDAVIPGTKPTIGPEGGEDPLRPPGIPTTRDRVGEGLTDFMPTGETVGDNVPMGRLPEGGEIVRGALPPIPPTGPVIPPTQPAIHPPLMPPPVAPRIPTGEPRRLPTEDVAAGLDRLLRR